MNPQAEGLWWQWESAVTYPEISCPCSVLCPSQSCSSSILSSAQLQSRALSLCWANPTMWTSLICFFWPPQLLHIWCNMTFGNCLVYLNPSVYRDGDLVLGGVSPHHPLLKTGTGDTLDIFCALAKEKCNSSTCQFVCAFVCVGVCFTIWWCCCLFW